MLASLGFDDLPGWATHDHAPALDCFQRSAQEILKVGAGFSRPVRFGGSREAWMRVCRAGIAARHARRFFEDNFTAYRVEDCDLADGLFTGYFEPEIPGSLVATPDFPVPLYRRPNDLLLFADHDRATNGMTFGRRVNGEPTPYFTRRDIEQGALYGQGLEIAWLPDWADAFFMQVQGSGRVRLEDGRILRLTYDGKNGLPYTSIGALLVEGGLIAPDEISMQAIRRWMSQHPVEARQLMWANESFVFFREVDLQRPDLGALGAQHVQLTPRRSLAVDRNCWSFGTPIWLDAAIPIDEANGTEMFRHLMIAQDTGSAIKGVARGDVYWGWGDEAMITAGQMKSPGAMTALLPREVVQELGLPP